MRFINTLKNNFKKNYCSHQKRKIIEDFNEVGCQFLEAHTAVQDHLYQASLKAPDTIGNYSK